VTRATLNLAVVSVGFGMVAMFVIGRLHPSLIDIFVSLVVALVAFGSMKFWGGVQSAARADVEGRR
jgi:hypothetical protein